MRLPSNIGMLLLSIWLILHGLTVVFNLAFDQLGTIMALLALAAGILLLIGR